LQKLTQPRATVLAGTTTPDEPSVSSAIEHLVVGSQDVIIKRKERS
jgi:hypothetical protein